MITFVLLLVVMGTATDDRAVGASAALGVGMTITAGIIATAPISGGSFNPARSLGPMFVSGSFPAWYVYIVGPVVGAVAAALLYDYVLRPGSPPEVGSSIQEFPKVEEDSIR